MTTTEDIQELKGEIRKLSVAIDGLETDAKVTTDKELKISIGAQIIAIMNQITAITNQITAKEQRLLFLEQQGLATTKGGEKKTIYLCLSSEGKNEEPRILEYTWNSTDAMRKSVKPLGGGFLYRNIDDVTGVVKCVQEFEDLEDGSIYYLYNDYYSSIVKYKTRTQAEDRVLEEKHSMALVNHAGGNSHVHRNIKFKDENGKDIAEIDRIVVVHKGGEDVPNSVAYVLESATSPQVKDAKILLDKVDFFNIHAPSLPHFRSVGSVVPVLGGKIWSDEVIQECKARNETLVSRGMSPILRIQPSGKDFKVIRGFSTFARTILKRL